MYAFIYTQTFHGHFPVGPEHYIIIPQAFNLPLLLRSPLISACLYYGSNPLWLIGWIWGLFYTCNRHSKRRDEGEMNGYVKSCHRPAPESVGVFACWNKVCKPEQFRGSVTQAFCLKSVSSPLINFTDFYSTSWRDWLGLQSHEWRRKCSETV